MNKHTAESTLLSELPERSIDERRSAATLPWTLLFAAGLFVGSISLFYQFPYLEQAQVAAFLLLGIFYVVVRNRSWPADGRIVPQALAFCLAQLLALLIFSWLAGPFQPLTLAFFGAAFLLPSLVAEAARLFEIILVSQKEPWMYSSNVPDESPFTYLEKKPVYFLAQTPTGQPETFTSVAPSSMPLGLAFFYAVKGAQPEDQWRTYFLDGDDPARWVFYILRFGFHKSYLDPYETLHENSVPTRSRIVAVRLDESSAN